MAEQFERVARPSSVLDSPGDTPRSRGINRNHLTLLLTVVGVLSAAAGAGISSWMSYYRFQGGEQQKAVAEAGRNDTEVKTLQTDARVNDILAEYNKDPASHPKLRAEIRKLDLNFKYVPSADALPAYEQFAFAEYVRRMGTSRKITAEVGVAEQDTTLKRVQTGEAHERTRKAAVDALGAEEVYKPAIPIFKRSIMGVTGNPNPLGMPNRDPHNPPPIARGLRGTLPGQPTQGTSKIERPAIDQ